MNGVKRYASEEYVQQYIEDNRVSPNWSQNDPSQKDYINNRTHWKQYDNCDLYSGKLSFYTYGYDFLGVGKTNYGQQTTIDITTHRNPSVIPNSIFITIDNNQTYNCIIPKEVSYTSGGLGMVKVKVGEDDYIACFVNYIGYNSLNIVCTEGLINCEFFISVNRETYYPISYDYLPSARIDWEQCNSSEKNYIYNRTHGKFIDYFKVYEMSSSNVPNYSDDKGYYVTQTPIEFENYEDVQHGIYRGQVSISFFEGAISQTISVNVPVYDEDVTYNITVPWASNRGYAFCLTLGEIKYDGRKYSRLLTICSEKDPSSFTSMEVSLYMRATKELDEKYIPQTIARVSDISTMTLSDDEATELLSELEGYVEEETTNE